MIGVGTLAAGVTAEVDAHGNVQRGPVRLGWRIRTADDWLEPGRDLPVRQSRPHAAPVVHSAVRIAGGDAVERVYSVGDGDNETVVVEVANESPEAIAIGFYLDAPGPLTLDLGGASIDGTPALAFARRPGLIEDGVLAVFPVPHRTRVRVGLTSALADVGACADVATVERAWERLLDRGLRTELPEPLQSDVDAARADLLLAPPSAEAFVALEEWGLDAEAVEMWARLPMRGRRATKKARAADVLGETRVALVTVKAQTIDMLPGFRAAWLGQHLAVHDVPLRDGSCSFAVRWHGARPALLWDVPPGLTIRAPVLDPAWSSQEPVGETLLAEPPSSLLSMGQGSPAIGTGIDAPDQFS